MKNKSALRTQYLLSRSQPFSQSINTKIQQKLVNFLLPKTFQHIAFYYPIRDEIDVFAIINMLPDKTFYLPRVIGKELEFGRVQTNELLVEGAFGILEPTAEAVENGVLDSVVVPGLAFTKDGGRLGYGGGFYDRFLGKPEIRKCVFVGVCPELLLVDELPIEKHDQLMDFVVTEKTIY